MADGYLLNDNASPILVTDPSYSLTLIILPARNFPLKDDFQAQITYHGPACALNWLELVDNGGSGTARRSS